MYLKVFEVKEDYDDELNTCQQKFGVRDIGGLLATLKGSSQFITIKLEWTINNNKVVVLIDNGATHNFIDEEFMRKEGFKTQKFEVAVGNGSVSSSLMMIENIKVKLGDYGVISDFYSLPLGGIPHIVLRVQWLYMLREVTSNYKTLEMKFKVQG